MTGFEIGLIVFYAVVVGIPAAIIGIGLFGLLKN